jgi:hypothetical protein
LNLKNELTDLDSKTTNTIQDKTHCLTLLTGAINNSIRSRHNEEKLALNHVQKSELHQLTKKHEAELRSLYEKQKNETGSVNRDGAAVAEATNIQKEQALEEEMRFKLEAIIRLETEIQHKRRSITPELLWSFVDNHIVPEFMRQKKRMKMDNSQVG